MSFLWGSGGSKLTPEELARARFLKQQSNSKGVDASPVDHWTQAAARVVDALGSRVEDGRLDARATELEGYNQNLMQSLTGGSPMASDGMPAMPGYAEDVMPAAARDQMLQSQGNVDASASPTMSPPQALGAANEIESRFMNGVRDAGVTNPYGLAAVAAYGKAESGYAPGNVNRTWSDPSESGKAGTSGGIMSWRNERLDNLNNFAQQNGQKIGNIPPETQAAFFASEDPALIAKLNSSQSPEEANRHMADAWKFAGYNREGGENARRLGLTQQYTDRYAQQPQPQQQASLGPQVPDTAGASIIQSLQQGGMPQQSAMPMQQQDQAPALQAIQQATQQQGMPAAAAIAPQQQMQAMPQPAPQMQAMPQQMQMQRPNRSAGVSPQQEQALVAALNDPLASPQVRNYAQQQLQRIEGMRKSDADQAQWEYRQQYSKNMQQQDPLRMAQLEAAQLQNERLRNPQEPETIRSLRMRAQEAGLQPGTPEYQQFMVNQGRQGQQINVDARQQASSKFYEEADKRSAESFSKLSTQGVQAKAIDARLGELDSLLANSPYGIEGGAKLALGRWGINTDGLSDLQAAEAVINQLVPAQREPGSGPMSDKDIEMYRSSVANIWNQPGANRLIIDAARGISQYNMRLGEISDMVLDGEMTPQQGRKAQRELPNPIDSYRENLNKFRDEKNSKSGRKTSSGVTWSVD